MPIDRNTFKLAKDPSKIIVAFLEQHQNEAFTEKEILTDIRELQDLGIPLQKIKDSLKDLIDRNEVEFAWVKGDVYYNIKEKGLGQL